MAATEYENPCEIAQSDGSDKLVKFPERHRSAGKSEILRGKQILHAPFEIAGNMAKICTFFSLLLIVITY